MDLFEEILSYGLTFILQGLVVWSLAMLMSCGSLVYSTTLLA